MFEIFKKKGCLDGKTKEQKEAFFQSLSKFALNDKQFFTEQYFDLTRSERKEFEAWIIKENEQKNAILSMLNVIEQLTKK